MSGARAAHVCPGSFKPFSEVHGWRKIRMAYSKHGTAFNSWDSTTNCLQSKDLKGQIPIKETSNTKILVEGINL